jgi:hypothetical protein
LVFAIAFSLFGLITGMLYFGLSLTEISAFVSNPDTDQAVLFLKFYQVVNQIGIFILPTLVFSFLVSSNSINYLTLNRVPKLISILLGGMIIYAILPFNNYLDEMVCMFYNLCMCWSNRDVHFSNLCKLINKCILIFFKMGTKTTFLFYS